MPAFGRRRKRLAADARSKWICPADGGRTLASRLGVWAAMRDRQLANP